MGNTIFERFDLGVDTYLSSRKARDAHLHLDELYPTLFLGLGGYLLHLADRGFGKVVDAQIGHKTVDDFFLNWSFHFFVYSLQFTVYR